MIIIISGYKVISYFQNEKKKNYEYIELYYTRKYVITNKKHVEQKIDRR